MRRHRAGPRAFTPHRAGYRRAGAAGARAEFKVCRAYPAVSSVRNIRSPGVDLSRSLLSGWVDACCRLLSPLEEALQDYVLTDGKLHADDTPVQVLLPGNKKTKTGRLWTYVRDDRNAGSALAPAVWFAYSPDRKGIHPQTHLAGFSGVLQADAYAGFNELYRNGRIMEAACWAHARRKIHDVHVRTPSALTDEALKRIGELYIIEAEIRGIPAEQRLAERQQKTKPLLKSLESWLREKMKTLSRHSELAKAFAYALNQWPALTYYADDGWAEADNNIAENALRTVSPVEKTGCSSVRITEVSAARCCTA